MTMEEDSRRVCESAVLSAGPAGIGWNKRFEDAVNAAGWTLAHVSKDVQIGKDGPIFAPTPIPGDEYQYKWPCVVAPKGWAG